MDQLEGLGVLSLGDENLLLLFYQLIKNVIVQKKLNHVPVRELQLTLVEFDINLIVQSVKSNIMICTNY